MQVIASTPHLTVARNVAAQLTEHTEAIRALLRRTHENAVEMGKQLTQAKELISHGDWLNWLDREFKWTERTARHLMHVYEMAARHGENFSDLNIPLSGLYLLAAPSTPVEVQKAVIERAKGGEVFSLATAKAAIAEAKADPAPMVVEPSVVQDDEPGAPTFTPEAPTFNVDEMLTGTARGDLRKLCLQMRRMSPGALASMKREVATAMEAL